MERTRYWVARLLDRLMPSMCWADLVTWSMASWRVPKRLSDCRRGPSCQRDVDRYGSCWCGKFKGSAAHSSSSVS